MLTIPSCVLMGFDRIFLFFRIVLLHTSMENAISFLILSKIIPMFQLQRLGGLVLSQVLFFMSVSRDFPPGKIFFLFAAYLFSSSVNFCPID